MPAKNIRKKGIPKNQYGSNMNPIPVKKLNKKVFINISWIINKRKSKEIKNLLTSLILLRLLLYEALSKAKLLLGVCSMFLSMQS